MGLKWSNSQTIGESLYDNDDATHPLTIWFTDLAELVLALEGSDDNPNGSSDGILDAIQMVWYEEWQEDQDPSEDLYANR